MKGKSRLSLYGHLFLAVFFFAIAPADVFAVGEYDGIWIGTETINIPGYGVETETTGTVVYQKDANTLSFWDELLTSVDLVRSGSTWVLPSPKWITYQGYSVRVDSISVTFQSATSLTGTINLQLVDLGITASATLSHTKKACQAAAKDQTVANISGAIDSVRCYEITLPADTTDLNTETWGGTGDADLCTMYYRPDFDFYLSENASNKEQIAIPSPPPGKWYIILFGFEAYSGLNLLTTYTDNSSVQPISISGDQVFDLTDIILGLQIAAAVPTSLPIDMEADVNGDGRIGMEEVLYALREVGK